MESVSVPCPPSPAPRTGHEAAHAQPAGWTARDDQPPAVVAPLSVQHEQSHPKRRAFFTLPQISWTQRKRAPAPKHAEQQDVGHEHCVGAQLQGKLLSALGDLPPDQHLVVLNRVLLEAAELTLGRTRRRTMYNDVVEQLSQKQRLLWLRIRTTNDGTVLASLKHERNALLKRLHVVAKTEALRRIEQQAAEIENFKDDSARFFAAAKRLRTFDKSRLVVHDHAGTILRQPAAVARTVASFFKDRLNDKESLNDIVPPFVGAPRPLLRPISRDEVMSAIDKLKMGKAADHSGVSAELYKAAKPMIAENLAMIYNGIFEQHCSVGLGIGTLIPLPKPGKPRGPCTSLRPINILLVARKILSTIVLTRSRQRIAAKLPCYQAAYQTGRSVTEGVWLRRMLVSIAVHFRVVVNVLGTDISAAFDSVRRSKLIEWLHKNQWFDQDELRIVQMLITNTFLRVRIGDALSELFEVTLGILQGDGLSAILFIIYFAEAIKQLKCFVGTVASPTLDCALQMPTIAAFADDLDHFSTDHSFLENLLQKAKPVLMEWNLILNEAKTERTAIRLAPDDLECAACAKSCRSRSAMCDVCGKWWHYDCVPLDNDRIVTFETDPTVLFQCPRCAAGTPIEVRDKEAWRKVRHLGTLLGVAEDIEKRKAAASCAFARLVKIWKATKSVSIQVRVRLFNAFVLPHLLFNAPTQCFTATQRRAIDSFHRRLLRRAIGVVWPDKIANNKLYQATKTQPISAKVVVARWRFFGHLLRFPPNNPAFRATAAYFRAMNVLECRPGAKRICLAEVLKKEAAAIQHIFGFELKNSDDLNLLRDLAADRRFWDRVCEAVAETTVEL